MRKNVISIMLFHILFLGLLFAGDSIDSSRIKINVPLSEAEEQIEVGFTDSPIAAQQSREEIIKLENLSLDTEEIEGGHILSQNVHAYWNVVSPNNFTLSLSASDLTDDSGNTLSFTARWIPHMKEEEVVIEENGSYEAKEVYTHNPSNGLSHIGSSEVQIETSPLGNAIPGVYRGRFILRVEGE